MSAEYPEPDSADDRESDLASSHSALGTPNSAHPPLTDSPFFWLVVFGAAALIGGLAIAPKYTQRMDRVERMYEARNKAYAERIGVDTSQTTVAMNRDVSIRELLIFVAVLLLGGGAVGRWWEVRQRNRSPRQK
ncbi:MAG: hypothetical protein JNM18_19415 [Planctomycetaceae bacterium]|nr:hypothetical protein [Planctomycetaceae bacterium]